MPPASGLDLRQAALFGLATSFAVYALSAWLGAALVRRQGPAALRPAWLIHAARFCFYVLFPYVLLLRGAGLLAAALGLLGPEPLAHSLLGWSEAWFGGLLWAAAVAAATWLALAGSLWAAGRAAGPDVAPFAPPQPRGWALLREVAFREVHWAFYRAALAVWLGPYGALFISLLLLAAEAATDPRTWTSLRRPPEAAALVMLAALAWLSTAVFYLTGNFWLAAGAHLLAQAALSYGPPQRRERAERLAPAS